MHLGGFATHGALARHLGLEGDHLPQRVRRWLNGTAKPDYEATLRLLAICGMLNEPRVQRGDVVEVAEVLLRRNEEVRRLLPERESES